MTSLAIMGVGFDLDHRRLSIQRQDKLGKELLLGNLNIGHSRFYRVLFDHLKQDLSLDYLEDSFTSVDVVKLPKSFVHKFSDDQNDLDKINYRSFCNDYNFTALTDHMLSRLNGKMAMVDVAGDKFYLDFHFGLLHPADPYYSAFRLGNVYCQYPNHRAELEVFYNTNTKMVVYPQPKDLLKLPKEVVHVKFPAFEQIDPIGYAIVNGRPPLYFLRQYQMIRNPTATVKPAREVSLIIHAAYKEHERIERVLKKAEKKGKGKGFGL